jgi:hypothetical protein
VRIEGLTFVEAMRFLSETTDRPERVYAANPEYLDRYLRTGGFSGAPAERHVETAAKQLGADGAYLVHGGISEGRRDGACPRAPRRFTSLSSRS